MSNLNFFNLYNIKYASKFDCYKVKSGNNTFIFVFIYFVKIQIQRIIHFYL